MHGSKLYVGNLDYSVSGRDLERLFAGYGEVKDVKMIDRKGIAFIEMGKQMDAEEAKKALNGTDLKGRKLNIDAAIAPTKKKRGGRGY